MYHFKGADPAVLLQILKESRLKYDQTSVSYVFTCPRCQGKKKLYIRKADGRFVCWKCKETESYQGRPEFALADLLSQPVKQVQSRLYGGEHIPVSLYLDVKVKDFFGDDDDVDDDAVEIATTFWPLEYLPIDHVHAARGAEYLHGRGIPLWMAKKYDIRYCPQKRRVVFPVNSGPALYGWQERIVIPNKFIDEDGNEREIPKILSSTGIPRDRTVMFADRLQGVDHAILCEGPVDALKAHFCKGNVAAMGKAVSREQVRLLVNAGIKKLYLALDPDAADEIQRLVRNNYDDFEMYEMIAPAKTGRDKYDLGAMEFAEVDDLFRSAARIGPGRLFIHLSYKY
jgi:hypothetical protein